MNAKNFKKKMRERSQFERFRQVCTALPVGRIENSEEPDFLVHSDERILGVEVTELYRPPEAGKQPLQEAESLQTRIVDQAQSIYEANGGPPLYVSVVFGFYERFNKKDVMALASRLAKFISSLSINEGDRLQLENMYEDRNYPEEITMLFIDRSPGHKQALWHPFGAVMVPGCAPKEIQARVDAKNKLCDVYRKKCQEIWLLIVVDGFSLSTLIDLPDETLNHTYESQFDRIFLFENFRLKPFELVNNHSII